MWHRNIPNYQNLNLYRKGLQEHYQRQLSKLILLITKSKCKCCKIYPTNLPAKVHWLMCTCHPVDNNNKTNNKFDYSIFIFMSNNAELKHLMRQAAPRAVKEKRQLTNKIKMQNKKKKTTKATTKSWEKIMKSRKKFVYYY